MTYDEAVKQIEEIVKQLEQAEALSISEYKQKAEQARQLLSYCEQQVVQLDKEIHDK